MSIMNNLFKKFNTLLIGMLAVTASIAQPVPTDTKGVLQLSLPEIWSRAEAYNKNIQLQKLHVQSSEEEIKDTKADRLPEIKIAGEYDYVSNMPLYENGIFHSPTQYPVLHNAYKVGGDAYLNLYNGNKTNLKIAEQETINQLRKEQQNLTTSDVKLRAASYYLDLQRGTIFKELMEKDIAEQERQLEHIRQLLKNGVVLKSDVLRAELQLSRQRLSLTTIENDIAIANQKLNILIGEPDSFHITPLQLPNTDSLTIQSYEDYLATAMSNSYQLKISQQQTELRRLQVKDAKANVSPKVGVFAEYNYAYPQIQFYPYAATLYGLGLAGVRASFPISGLYQNKHKVTASEIEYRSQELEHANTEDVIRQQVREAYLRYQEALKRISVARTNVQSALENARIVNNTYFNQLSLITDLLDANTQVLQTKFDLAAAQIAAQLQYYQLQNAIGNL
jgi:outer membrane protein